MPQREIKILIIDDSPAMVKMLKVVLGREHTVAVASNGREGIELYRSFQPDVILLDINMPVLDGFGVLEHVRNEAQDFDVFILMLTAEDAQELKPRALNLGANDFLFKPFDHIELLARIGVAVRQVRLTRQLRGYVSSISREIEMLASLQARLLPKEQLSQEKYEVKSLYLPSGLASGDYFDYFPTNGNSLRCVIADVSGHGARAAFIMAIVRTLFRSSRPHYLGLAETLQLVNMHLLQIIADEDDFVSVFAADLDFATGRMEYLNCGHCPGLLLNQDGEAIRLDPCAPILGFFEVDFVPQEEPIDTGSQLFLYTDGFYEWEVEPGACLDQDVFLELAGAELRRKGAFLDNLMQGMASLTPDTPRFRDDLTALWVQTRSTGDE